jgi:hypothetical protein
MGKKSREKTERTESPPKKAARQAIRQQWQPKEFRIEAPKALPLEAIAHVLGARPAPRASPSVAEVFPPETLLRFLADLGTGLWRLKQRLVDPSTGQPLEEMRRAYRHFESVWDVLAEAGVQIRDHKREFLPERGFSGLHVSAYQPTPGLKKERVIDTVKPTISIKRAGANQDILIQMGEVIVGTPEERGGEVSSPQDETPKRV